MARSVPTSTPSFFRRLAYRSYDRRGTVVLGWFAALIILSVLSATVGGEFRTQFSIPGSESQAAIDILNENGFGERTGLEGQVVLKKAGGVNTPAVQQELDAFLEKVKTEVPGTSVISPFTEEGAGKTSPDGTVAYAQINFADRSQEEYLEAADHVKALVKSDLQIEGVEVNLGGDVFATFEEPSSELIGIACAMVILLVAFGSILAMGFPIIAALFGVGSGFALIGLLTHAISMPDFTTAVAGMIGLGVGIDYALFIVTRFRTGLEDGLEPREAVATAIDTAGRAVIFAGITVVISLLGMIFMGLDMMRGLAVGASITVLMTMLASVTLVPAIMGFAGHSINHFKVPPFSSLKGGRLAIIPFYPFIWIGYGIQSLMEAIGHGVFHTNREKTEEQKRHSFWHRWSHQLQANPWVYAIGGFAILILLSIPVLSLRLGFSDAGNRPESDTTRRAYDTLAAAFGPGSNGTMLGAATMSSPSDLEGLAKIGDAIRATPGVAFVSPPIPNAEGTAAIMQIIPVDGPQDEATAKLVHTLREDVIPAASQGTNVDFKLGGITAGSSDFADFTAERLPYFFLAVLTLSFLLLMVVFRSILVPLKAIIMNLLSIGAAYGVLVAVFQWGWGLSLLGVGKEGPIEAWVPMMLFAIVFGLSMDYEVFLLSRIKEEYDRTKDNASAVADGLASTARVISAAALIMVCVFGSFILGDERGLKIAGLGLAVAVAIDATIIRLILVPATMELLGDRNWWMPKWLDRVLPVVHVEAAPASGVPTTPPPAKRPSRA